MVRRSDAAALAGAAGILGVVLPLAGLAVEPIWSFPSTGATDAELTAFVVAHRGALQATMVLDALGVTLWLVFGAALSARLRPRVPRTEGSRALLACLSAGFGVFAALLLAGFTAFDVVVYRAPRLAEPGVLYDLTFGLLAMSGPPTTVALGAYAALTWRGGVLPRWTAALAALTALAHVVLLASFIVTGGFLSLEGEVITVVPGLLFAWILATGAVLSRGASTATCGRGSGSAAAPRRGGGG